MINHNQIGPYKLANPSNIKIAIKFPRLSKNFLANLGKRFHENQINTPIQIFSLHSEEINGAIFWITTTLGGHQVKYLGFESLTFR